MYPDQNWKEMCGMLANLVTDSGAGKGRKPGGYGETSLDGMEKQAWRLWRNKPGWHGETGLEAMEK